MKRLKELLYGAEWLEELILILHSPSSFVLDPVIGRYFQSTPAGTTRPRIIIVSTWLHKSPIHWFWRWYLQRKGFETALLYIPMKTQSFEQSARTLKDWCDRTDARHVVLAGISSGALTCLVYLGQLNGWERVSRLVAIGTPFRGTYTALLLFSAPHARSLLPGSPFMRRLSVQEVGHPERIVCLSARYDELVPRSSSCLSGAHLKIIDVAGHNNLHSTFKATYDEVARVARESAPAAR